MTDNPFVDYEVLDPETREVTSVGQSHLAVLMDFARLGYILRVGGVILEPEPPIPTPQD